MAKVNGVNKKLLAKKDMNFFAEFTANAAKAARMLGYGVAAGVLVVFVVLTFIVAFFIRNTIIKGQIKDLQNTLNGPDYASLEQDAAVLSEELNDMTNYYYALTQMRKNVDLVDTVPTELPDIIEKCIPSDSFIRDYTITNSTLSMSGYSFTYYSPVDMVNMLNEKNVFTSRPNISVVREDIASETQPEDLIDGDMVDAINNYYQFTVSGTLITNVHISVTRFQEGTEIATSIGGVETIDVKAGDAYAIEGVSQITYAGVTYQLTRITVDGNQVDDAHFAIILQDNKYSDVARGNYDIRLYYAPVTADAAATEG
ncbi:hypothetical protein SAMN02910264_00601 [Ruminococcaceae bacterium YAD3003]|nr:hypothetical protein SAMN02910264_00601 [Ruminococcaceae bacterium YAD3003]